MDKASLILAKYKQPSRVHLRFADGFSGTWSFDELELDMSGMKVETIKASGKSMKVISKSNDFVEIDSSSLRAAVDATYAAELEKAFLKIRGPIDLIKVVPGV